MSTKIDRKDLPVSSDDPQLVGWYHTVDLGNGLRSIGDYDLRSTVDLHGLPESLEGKTALDVGTWDGFWAYELERRGADVTAIDIERWGDFDWLPWVRESKGPQVETPSDEHFWLAHDMRGSRVQRKICNVYDLSPDVVGTFDVVFCGSMVIHLQNPLKAITNIRSVTREMAVVTALLSEEIEALGSDKPWLSFGHRGGEAALGDECLYWHFSTRGLREMMEYAGFARTKAMEPVSLPPTENRAAVVIGYPND
jgi:tRNA (mo5U34)-methyltransferase